MISSRCDDALSYYKSIVDAYEKGELWTPSEKNSYNFKMVINDLNSNNCNLEN